MSAAVVGLVGVVIGGLLTGGVNYLLERRRERRSGRAAARLIGAALSDAEAFIGASLIRRMWVGDPREALSDDVWREHRNVLAEAPDFDGWYPTAGAWGWISQLRRLAELFDEDPGDDPLGERDEDFFRLGLLMVRIADTALTEYAKTKSYREQSDTEVPPDHETEGEGDDSWMPQDDPIEQLLTVAREAKPKSGRRRR